MALDPVIASAPGGWRLSRPWRFVLCGLGLTCVGIGFPLVGLEAPSFGVAHAVLVFAGLVVAGFAVSSRLTSAGQELEERLESAGLVAVATFVALLGCLGNPWDSARWFLGVLTAVGIAGSILVLLPSFARRLVATVLVVFHFGGILTAITSVEPPNGSTPWVPMASWFYVYRPYLTFMYLGNAYHFYSPEPGPASLLWCRLQYESGESKWVKFPYREDSPVPLHFQRLLALTESTNQAVPGMTPTPEMIERRQLAGIPSKKNKYPSPGIPLDFNWAPLNIQYHQLTPFSQAMVSSYSRHLVREHPYLDDPANKVVSVRVYRVTHSIMTAPDMAKGRSPLDPSLFLPYYLGEFTPEGDLVKYDDDGKAKEGGMDDPFLYWLLPIIPRDPNAVVRKGPADFINTLEMHARDLPQDFLEPKKR
jgi:hypothetical protein